MTPNTKFIFRLRDDKSPDGGWEQTVTADSPEEACGMLHERLQGHGWFRIDQCFYWDEELGCVDCPV